MRGEEVVGMEVGFDCQFVVDRGTFAVVGKLGCRIDHILMADELICKERRDIK